MIHLITGKTGNAKTLYGIDTIEKRRIEENRAVYYHGIPELKLDWIEFDNAREWTKIPNGAIIVIDEARPVFPVRPNGSPVPEYVAAFELHRKQGHDIYIFTQQPTFIDIHIRKLTDVHYHCMRKFGSEESVIHKWFTCKDDCDKNRSDSIKENYVFNKDLYGKYKSAEMHTIKPQKPFRYYLKYIIPLVVVALIAVAYFAFSSAINKSGETSNAKKEELSKSGGGFFNPNQSQQNNTLTDEEFYRINTPRVATLAHSAPKYDKLTEPKIVPVPAACIKSSAKCTCYSQQGTKMTTDQFFCENVVKNGYFIDWEETTKDNKTQTKNPVVRSNPDQVAAIDDAALKSYYSSSHNGPEPIGRY